MTKPGRNEPCPCGSGKKFKHCHAKMALDPAAVADRTWQRLRRLLDGYPATMLGFVRDVYGPDALHEAWSEFLLWEGDIEFDPDTPHMQAFMPWFFHRWAPDPLDTSISHAALHDRSPTAVFLERRGRRLDPLLRQYLEACASTPFSFHEIIRCQPGKGFRCRDMFVGDERDVLERSGSRIMQVGDAIFGQIVTCRDITLMEACGPHPIPPGSKIELIELRERMSGSVHPPTPETLADWDIELRDAYLDITEALTRLQRPEVQNTDGDDIAFHQLTFEIGSARKAFDSLRHLASEETESELLEVAEWDEKGQLRRVSFAWTVPGNRTHAGWDNTVLGHIEIDGSRLVANVNSAERAARFRSIVEEHLGAEARHLATEVQSVEDALEAHREVNPHGPLDDSGLAEHPEVRQRLSEVMAAHYEAWLSEKIPALGGLTPLEAVQVPAGREKVAALIDQIARDGQRMQPKLDQTILRNLRERLGLA